MKESKLSFENLEPEDKVYYLRHKRLVEKYAKGQIEYLSFMTPSVAIKFMKEWDIIRHKLNKNLY